MEKLNFSLQKYKWLDLVFEAAEKRAKNEDLSLLPSQHQTHQNNNEYFCWKNTSFDIWTYDI